jgi:type VI secretion system protein ImpK
MSSLSADDPFGSLDHTPTWVKPVPPLSRPPTAGLDARSNAMNDVASDVDAEPTGLNPLVAAANPVLALVPQMRATTHLHSADALRDSLAQAIRDFELRARQLGVNPDRSTAARYVLCTLLDETAAHMPWGVGGQWNRHSLLAMFHNEAGGGEKVFRLLAKLGQDSKSNEDLLELIYAAITLGFQGRYRSADGGAAQLESIRERLAGLVLKGRGPHSGALAENWAPAVLPRRSLLSWLPVWVVAALVLMLLCLAYALFSWRLGAQSDPVYERITALRLPTAAAPRAPAPLAAGRLGPPLKADIDAGLLSVRDETQRSVVILRGDGLFAPGSASVDAARAAVLQRVAAALAKSPGRVLVAGHTDNVPISTARFPSNWHLSEARAQSVRQLFAENGVDPGRIVAEGRAAAEPVADNKDPAGRALNRRVEVVLQVASGAGTSP